jgi:hypothetical protein
MERFFSQQNIDRYRKLLDISTDEPERRLIFKLLAEQTIQMDTNGSLTVRVQRRGDKYTWELHRDHESITSSATARSIGDTLPQRLAWHQLDFGETPHVALLSAIESGPLWRGRRYLSANLAMSDHLSRAGRAGIGRHRGSIHLSS